MTKKIPDLSVPKDSLKTKNNRKIQKHINRSKKLDYNQKVLFTFEDFKFESIKLSSIFNNYYKDEKHCIKMMYTILSRTLQEISRESLKELLSTNKSVGYRFHVIDENLDKVRRILEEYNYSESYIENILEGNQLYQVYIKKGVNAPRLILHRVENIFSVLFIDVNHHIYFDIQKSKENNSIKYDFFPEYCMNKCSLLDEFGDCILIDYLDVKKYKQTQSYQCDMEECLNLCKEKKL